MGVVSLGLVSMSCYRFSLTLEADTHLMKLEIVFSQVK